MRRSALSAVLVALATLLPAAVLTACGGGGDGAAAVAATPGTVVVKNLKYSPKTITIDAGDTVTWKFDDGRIPHDVQAADFKSPTKKGGSWSRTFTTAGTYAYRCSLHPYMKGIVEVR